MLRYLNVRFAFTALVAVALAACGGGGGSPGTTVGNPGGSTGNTGGTTATNTVTLAMTDGSGATINSLSGGQSGTLKATVKSATGTAVPNAIVNFKSSDNTLVVFNPVSASALTDANGVAVMTVKPASVTSAGATTIEADAVVNAVTASGTVNIAVGAAPLTVGTLSFTPVPAGALPAFSAIQLNIPVTSGGKPADSVTGLTMSSLCQGDGLATLVQGSLNNGVLTATYTNNGCLRGNDTITVSIGSSSQTISLAVSAANIGAINFVGSNLSGSSIVLKGSGGQGRSEAATLTFRVVDQHNNGLAGVDVNFRATTTTGGLLVTPTKATTDATGSVSTIVTSGTIPTPVRVIAEATRNGVTISGLSDVLTISTGLPIQRSMSMSSDKYNIEGWNTDGTTANITVMMADQFGNPVSDGTAINFITEGGAVGSSSQGACTTTNGGCTVSLRSQEFRPTNGRVTVLAYAQGIEDFVDSNGDGQYTCANPTDVNGNPITQAAYRPLVDLCASGGEPFTDLGDAFLDAGKLGSTAGTRDATTGLWPATWLDGAYDPANGDKPVPYNHTTYSAAGDGKWGINYIRRQVEITFSDSYAKLVRQDCSSGVCKDMDMTDPNSYIIAGVSGAGCSTKTLTFRLYDVNNNPMPADTTVSAVDTDKLSPQTFSPSTVPSTNAIGGTIHSVSIKPDSQCAAGRFSVSVKTPKGIVVNFGFSG